MTRTKRLSLTVGAAAVIVPLGACGSHTHHPSTTVVHHVTVPAYHSPVYVDPHHTSCHTVTTHTYTYKRVGGKLKRTPVTSHHTVCTTH